MTSVAVLCGEVFCEPASNYNIKCSMCPQQIVFDEFIGHFQALHLNKEKTGSNDARKTNVDKLQADKQQQTKVAGNLSKSATTQHKVIIVIGSLEQKLIIVLLIAVHAGKAD